MLTDADKIRFLEKAIEHLKYARFEVRKALGNTDSYRDTSNAIEDLIEDMDADIVFFREGQPQ